VRPIDVSEWRSLAPPIGIPDWSALAPPNWRVEAPVEPARVHWSAPEGATASVDGGAPSLSRTLVLEPGVHRVVFTHPELGARTHELSLEPGEERRLAALSDETSGPDRSDPDPRKTEPPPDQAPSRSR
jgi:hypothetical protein